MERERRVTEGRGKRGRGERESNESTPSQGETQLRSTTRVLCALVHYYKSNGSRAQLQVWRSCPLFEHVRLLPSGCTQPSEKLTPRSAGKGCLEAEREAPSRRTYSAIQARQTAAIS